MNYRISVWGMSFAHKYVADGKPSRDISYKKYKYKKALKKNANFISAILYTILCTYLRIGIS